MRERILTALLLFLLLTSFSPEWAFKPKDFTISNEEIFGGARYDALHQVKENLEGGYIAVGQSRSWSEGKEDFYILLTNRNCEKIFDKRLGRSERDVALSVEVAKDGGYVVAGYTDSPGEGYKGGRDAVILKLDHQLRDVWFKSGDYSTINDEQFHDIAAVGDAGFVLTGIQKNQLYVVRIDNDGEELWRLRWDQHGYSEGNAIIVTSDRHLLITGSSGSEDNMEQRKLLVLSLSLAGEVIWHQNYETEFNLIQGHDIIEKPDGSFAISGIAYSRKYQRDGALLLLTPTGELMGSQAYGHYSDDAFFALSQNYLGDLYLFGHGRGRGDKRENGWALKVSGQNGERIWNNDERNFLGKDKRDEVFDGIHTSDGSMVMVGSSTRFPRSGEAWIIKLEPEFPSYNTPRSGDLLFEDVRLIDADQNNILTSGERAYLLVTLANQSNQSFYNLAANINVLSSGSGVRLTEEAAIGMISGEAKSEFIIPILHSDSLQEGTEEISIQLVQKPFDTPHADPLSWQQIGAPHLHTLATDHRAQPILRLENLEFEALGDKGFQRGSQMRLALNVINRGNATAHNVSFQFRLPETVRNISPVWQFLNDLEPGERVRQYAEFEPGFLFFEDSLEIQVRVIDSTMQYYAEDTLYLTIEEEEILPQPITRDIYAQWLAFGDSTRIVVKDSVFGARVNLYSNHPLSKEGLDLLVNDEVILPDESHLREFVHDEDFKDVYRYQYRYQCQFHLSEGLNRIFLKTTSQVGEYNTVPIEVTYDPVRPSLHILSIGVPLPKIKDFASNDAKAFVETFGTVGSHYFENIQSVLLDQARLTTERGLAHNIGKLWLGYNKGNIKPEDVLLIFISSHATIATPGTFKIKGSNFDGFYPDLTSVDYIEVVERFLRQINCQKIVLLDVFNERQEPNDDEDSKEEDPPLLSETFVKLMRKQPRSTPVILSCAPGEASFENAGVERGVFAHSIFDALTTENLPLLDQNQNNVITIKEFFTQLKKRVIQFADNSQPQTPYFEDHSISNDFGLVQVATF